MAYPEGDNKNKQKPPARASHNLTAGNIRAKSHCRKHSSLTPDAISPLVSRNPHLLLPKATFLLFLETITYLLFPEIRSHSKL
ncbi:unnamed protein product [Prunus armeniaca]